MIGSWMIAFAAPAALAGASSVDDPYRGFGDWSSVCDNGLRCQVSSQLGQAANIAVHMRVRREPGPDAPVELSLYSSSALPEGPRSLAIDGLVFPLAGRGHDLHVPRRSAAAAARAVAYARVVEVVAGRERFPISARGSAAALRDMDARQGRAGTVTAIVATGRSAASSVPPPPALPIRLERRRSRSGLVIRPTPQRLARWRRAEGCDTELDPAAYPVQSWPLDHRSAVILVMCRPGAHNSDVLVKVGTRADGGDAQAALFDVNASLSERTGPSVAPVNPHRSETTGRLASGVTGGIAYPSSHQEWVWDGRRFRLIESSGSYGSLYRARVLQR